METWALEHPVLTFIIAMAFIFGFRPVNIVLANGTVGDKKDESE